MNKTFKLGLGNIVFDLSKAAITSIKFNNNSELIEKPIPFFAIKLRNRDASSYFIDASKFQYIRSMGKNHYFDNDQLSVCLYLDATKNRLTSRINITNKTDLLIEQVELLSFGLCPRLKDEDKGVGEIYIPYNEGAKVTNLERRFSSPFPYYDVDYPSMGKFFVFPNMISSQFVSYHLDGYGVYLGMHDKRRTIKHIDFNKVDNALKLQLRTFANTDFGQDYQMDFDSVIELYKGSMYEAFDIYRDWFYKNKPNNLVTIKENKYLPSWYKESPLVVAYPIRGENDADTLMKPNKALHPYMNGLKILKEIQEKTDSKILNLLMHYEGTAPWAPPYYFEPYGGLNEFNEYVTALHNNNMLIGLYASGFGYTLESYRGNYNKEQEFYDEHLSDIMCSNTNGELKSTIVQEIRHSYDMCPSEQRVKDIIKNETEKMLKSNVDYFQILDQNHGGCAYLCYSTNHNHIPAPGYWEVEETIATLKGIENKSALFGCESAAGEPLIPYLLFSDNRFILNYYIGEPFPIYSYLYHEFVNNFQGNQICMTLENKPYSYTYRLAYSFTCGDMFTVVLNSKGEISDAWCNKDTVDKEKVLPFIKTLNRWRIDQKEFLLEGKMDKPLSIKVDKLPIKHEDDYEFHFDAVLTSTFTNGKENASFLVNYDLEPHIVYFDSPTKVYLDSKCSTSVIAKQISIPPMTVYMVKNKVNQERVTYLNHHSESQKSFNEILNLIIEKSRITRREIQKLTGYSWGTVSSVVSILLDQEIILETDKVTNGVGRSTSYLIPNGNKYVSIGVDINSTGFSSSVVGIDSKVIKTYFEEYKGNTYDYAMELLFKSIQKCIDFVNDEYEIISIGVSCQGSTLNDGVYEEFKFAEGWKNINLKEILEDKFGIYTHIEHDVSCLMETYLYKNEDHPDSFLLCRAVSGIGFSLYINYRKDNDLTIDFGNMIIASDNKEKTLEDCASTLGIMKLANVDDFEIINSNRDKYRNELDIAANYFGIGFVNISRILPIKKIVVTGCVINNDQKMLDKIIAAYNEYEPIRSYLCSVEYVDDLSAPFGAARLSMLNKIKDKNLTDININE